MFHQQSGPRLVRYCSALDCTDTVTRGSYCSKHLKQNPQQGDIDGYFAYNTPPRPPPPPPVVLPSQAAPPMRAKRSSRLTFKTVVVSSAPPVSSSAPIPVSASNSYDHAHGQWRHMPRPSSTSYPSSPNGHGSQSPQTQPYASTPTPTKNNSEFIPSRVVPQTNDGSFRTGLRAPNVRGPWDTENSIEMPGIGRQGSSSGVANRHQPTPIQPSQSPQPVTASHTVPSLAPTAFMKHAMGTNHGSYLTNSHVTNGTHTNETHGAAHTVVENENAMPRVNGNLASAQEPNHPKHAGDINTTHDTRDNGAGPQITHQRLSQATPTMQSVSVPATPEFVNHTANMEPATSARSSPVASVDIGLGADKLPTSSETAPITNHNDIKTNGLVQKKRAFDSDAFDAMIYQRTVNDNTVKANSQKYLWLPVDPRIHKLHKRTEEWYTAKTKEIATRPRRKVWFGKVAARIDWLLKQERADRRTRNVARRQQRPGPRKDPKPAAYNRPADFGQVRESDLPEDVLENGAWLAACEWHRKSCTASNKQQHNVQDMSVDAWRLYNHLKNGGSLP